MNPRASGPWNAFLAKTSRTNRSWLAHFSIDAVSAASYTLAVPSSLPVAIRRPSGDHETDRTAPYAVSGSAGLGHRPRPKPLGCRHRCRWPGRVPSGDHETDQTADQCPSRVRFSLPPDASHILTVPSKLPVANNWPSGDQDAELTSPGWSLNMRRSDLPAASHNLAVPSGFRSRGIHQATTPRSTIRRSAPEE